MPTIDPTTVRELAHRAGDGLEVTLLWHEDGNRVVIVVDDARTGERFEIEVPTINALDAFEHPFAYAPADPSVAAGRRVPQPV
ncbi:MAG TPA: hypothetical protein VFU10_11730 [Gaiellaceae bacterium]|nr:hypothetical protein [Gaiellaceae bacterium]